MVRGALALMVLAATPLAAQAADPAPKPVPAPVRRSVAQLPPGFPSPPVAERITALDIPQAAKDAGHNGAATYIASIGPDGTLIALTLKESSMSPAIDAVVRARAERLSYQPSRDEAGKAIAGTVEVRASYARYDADSPGGGIETYTCGDLVREWDWFTAANARRRKLFWPHNAYTSLTSVEAMRQGITPSREDRLMVRAQREKMWAKLIKRCRKQPTRLMLAEVDQPQAYANLVDSF
jgi:hypothetical protein